MVQPGATGVHFGAVFVFGKIAPDRDKDRHERGADEQANQPQRRQAPQNAEQHQTGKGYAPRRRSRPAGPDGR